MRITSKTVHHIMEDNFALRYVLKYPGVNSWAELVPSPLTPGTALRAVIGSGIITLFAFYT
jgi:hypothetical protein